MSNLEDKFIKINAENLHRNKAQKSCEHWLSKAIGLHIDMSKVSNHTMQINGDDDVFNLSGYIAGQISLVRQPQVRSYLRTLFDKGDADYQSHNLKASYEILHHIHELVARAVYLSPLDERLWLMSYLWKDGKNPINLINTHDNRLIRMYFHINTLAAVYWKKDFPRDSWRDLLGSELDQGDPQDLLPKGVKSHLCRLNLALNQFMYDEKLGEVPRDPLAEASEQFTKNPMEARLYYHTILRAITGSKKYLFSQGYMLAVLLWNRTTVKRASQFMKTTEKTWFVRGTTTLILKSILIIDRACQQRARVSKYARNLVRKLYGK